MANTKHILAYILSIAVLAVVVLLIIGLNTTDNNALKSSSINIENSETPSSLSANERTRIESRLERLRAELKTVTNDPDRALQIRGEIQFLEEELKN